MQPRMGLVLIAVLLLAEPIPGQEPNPTPPVDSPFGIPSQNEEFFTDEDASIGRQPFIFDMGTMRWGEWWCSADYVLGFIHSGNIPPLVTTSPLGTAQTSAGVFGDPSSSILFGGSVNGNARSGFQVATGYWFGPEKRLGIEAAYVFLESQSTPFFANSSGNPILARPFLDTSNNTPSSLLVAFPGVASGGVAAAASSAHFQDFHLDLREEVITLGVFRLESLLGYRYLRFDDALDVHQTLFPTGPFVAGTRVDTRDRFGAQNEFHGGEFGLRALFQFQRLSLDVLTKIAAGNVNRSIDISGNTLTSVPGSAPVNAPGGLLALSTNSGPHFSHDWMVVPEVGLKMGYQVTSYARFHLGYNLFVWTRVARAGDQVDFKVNQNLLNPPVPVVPAPTNPAFNLRRTDLLVQMLNFGLEFHF